MKHYLLLILSLLVTLVSAAKDDAEAKFYSAPRSVVPYASRMQRMDLVDYFKSGSDKKIDNAIYGKSRILSLSDQEIVIEETQDSSSITHIILDIRGKADTTIIVINNLSTPAIDGRIEFYDAGWNKIDKKQFAEPRIKDWCRSNKSQDIDVVKNVVPFVMAKYDFDTSTSTLTLTQSFETYVSEEDYDKISPLTYSRLQYRWDGKKMKLVAKE